MPLCAPRGVLTHGEHPHRGICHNLSPTEVCEALCCCCCAVTPHTVWLYGCSTLLPLLSPATSIHLILPPSSAHIRTHLGCSVCVLCDCAVGDCQLTPPPPTRPPPSATSTRCVPLPFPPPLFLCSCWQPGALLLHAFPCHHCCCVAVHDWSMGFAGGCFLSHVRVRC